MLGAERALVPRCGMTNIRLRSIALLATDAARAAAEKREQTTETPSRGAGNLNLFLFITYSQSKVIFKFLRRLRFHVLIFIMS